jgi:deoxyribose-phosphate aldolase
MSPHNTLIPLIDHTDLSEHATEASTDALCRLALSGVGTRLGSVAAVCVWPQFVTTAKRILGNSDIRIATIANFPHGGTHTVRVEEDVREALQDGADEIDLVFPYTTFLQGQPEYAREMMESVRGLMDPALIDKNQTLKIILETGALSTAENITKAAELAIACGADFLKTSTGKHAINAPPPAVQTLLTVIQNASRPVGLKISGGIKTAEDAAPYLALITQIMGKEWINPQHVRLGSSTLYAHLVVG